MKNNIQFLLLLLVSFFLSALISFTIISTVEADTLSVSDDTFLIWLMEMPIGAQIPV
jgi:hypothetical protein